MKYLLMIALSLSAGHAFACRLTTPIELNTLLLESSGNYSHKWNQLLSLKN
jgi:hypothetical protein